MATIGDFSRVDGYNRLSSDDAERSLQRRLQPVIKTRFSPPSLGPLAFYYLASRVRDPIASRVGSARLRVARRVSRYKMLCNKKDVFFLITDKFFENELPPPILQTNDLEI